MWIPSADFTYGVGAGLGVWFCFEILRILRACVEKKPTPPSILYQTPTTSLSSPQPLVSQRIMSLPKLYSPSAPPREPGLDYS